jgi:hypothetical protein
MTTTVVPFQGLGLIIRIIIWFWDFDFGTKIY